jgi:hypothetical protein
LEEKLASPLYKAENRTVGTRCADHAIPLSPQKLALTSSKIGGPLVGIVCSRTQATEFSLAFFRAVRHTVAALSPGTEPLGAPLDRKLGAPQSRCERHGEDKRLAPTGTRTPAPWQSNP